MDMGMVATFDMNPIASKRKNILKNYFDENSSKRRKETKYNEKEVWKKDTLLLVLCDGGETSLFVSALMEFLTVEDVGRCEMVCRALKHQARFCWDRFDKVMIRGDPTRISAIAKMARERVIHHHLASTLARRIGNMGDSINKHLFVENHNNTSALIDERMHGGCNGCDFPDELDFGVLQESAANDYALFVRFSKTSDNTLLAEGFVNFVNEFGFINVELNHLDFSNWSQLMEISHLVALKEDEFDDDDLLDECMCDLTATVVGVRTKHKGNCFNVNLVFAQSGFGDGGIDHMGDHGYCWTNGHLRSGSHDPRALNPRTRKRHNGPSSLHREHGDMEVNLGMYYFVPWTDAAEDSTQTGKERCHWLLKCSYDKIMS